MTKINEIVEKIHDNQQKGYAFQKGAFSVLSETEWNDKFSKKPMVDWDIYPQNTKLIKELQQLCELGISEEDAQFLYEESRNMYRSHSMDYRIFLPVLEALISFYSEKKCAEKMVVCHTIRNYAINRVKNPQFSILTLDFTDVDAIISYVNDYKSFEEEEVRNYVWDAFQYKIVEGLRTQSISSKEAFACYDKMMEAWNREEVQVLDGKNESMLMKINLVYSQLSNAVFTIDFEDEEIKNRFYTISKNNYILQYKFHRNEYDIDATIYGSYLYARYLKKEQSIEEIFEEYLDYFCYGLKKYQKEASLGMDGVLFFMNSTRVLFGWSLKGVSEEKKQRMFASFEMLSLTNWKYVGTGMEWIHNMMLEQVCNFLLRNPMYHGDVEEMIFQLVIKRNFFAYMSACQIGAICKYLFDKIYEIKPELITSVTSQKPHRLRKFLENSAKLQDYGIRHMVPFMYMTTYEMSEEEIEEMQKHPEFGAHYMESIPKLQKYKDVILGHHKHYDGVGGYPKDYDNTSYEYRVITDILFLANQLDSMTDLYAAKVNEISFEEVFEDLAKGRGTKYNPDLVDLILANSEIQMELIRLLTEEKMHNFMEYFRDIENNVGVITGEEFAVKVLEKMREVNETNKTDSVKPYINRLFEYAAREQSDKLYAQAYYYSMFCANKDSEHSEAINLGLEAIRYAEKSESVNYLPTVHNIVAQNICCLGNPINGIGHYLQAIEYADNVDNPIQKGMCYNNLGSVFRQMGLNEKALSYYEKSLECFEGAERYYETIFYNILLSNIFLDQRENVKVFREKIRKYHENNGITEENLKFPYRVAEAYLAHYDGDDQKTNYWIESSISDMSVFTNYRLYVEEVELLLDLLMELKRYNTLMTLLDQYIDFSRKNQVSHYILESFLQKRTICVQFAKDYTSPHDMSEYLWNVMQEQKVNRADLAEQVETAYLQDMQRENTQYEIIKDNRKLEKKVKEAQEASEAKSRFLSSMSHEIRTPIHTVIGLDEMILRESKEEHVIQYAKDIKDAGNTLLSIVNDVLDFSKMEAGKIKILYEEYVFLDFIREIQEEFALKAQKKGLYFEVQCDPKIYTKLVGDSPRIKQILQNLLSNAIKYTKTGGVTLQVDQEEKENKNLTLRFSVKDTGIGVKKEEMNKLLKPFERAELEKNSSIEGTGLGLSIVSMLVEKMGGHLEIESNYGEGSQFIVSLLQRKDSNECIGEVDFSQLSVKENMPLIAPEAKILVVDDNAVNIKVITNLLKRTQMQVTTARSGQECLNLCLENEYDMILLDHMMPEMDGLETLQKLKDQQKDGQTQCVIAMTANSGSGAMEFYKNVGFEDFISKPVDPALMEKTIQKYLPSALML